MRPTRLPRMRCSESVRRTSTPGATPTAASVGGCCMAPAHATSVEARRAIAKARVIMRSDSDEGSARCTRRSGVLYGIWCAQAHQILRFAQDDKTTLTARRQSDGLARVIAENLELCLSVAWQRHRDGVRPVVRADRLSVDREHDVTSTHGTARPSRNFNHEQPAVASPAKIL